MFGKLNPMIVEFLDVKGRSQPIESEGFFEKDFWARTGKGNPTILK
jgi:hypothetical protein